MNTDQPTRRRTGNRFTVRKQTSGYTGRPTFYVYDREAQGRVTVNPHTTRDGAEADAARLNASLGWSDPK